MSKLVHLINFRPKSNKSVYFSRKELDQLLTLYSNHVIQGEWRDYALDHHPGMAVFSIYRHSQDHPIYAIAKIAGNIPGAFEFMLFQNIQRLKQSDDLADVLKYFANKLRVVKD